MFDEELLHSLSQIGMTQWEAKLYMALLTKDESNAAELHRISGVLRTKVYETLERMVARGYCMERIEGNRRYYRAVPPDTLLIGLQKKWDNELDKKKKIALQTLHRLQTEFESGNHIERPLDFIEVMRSKHQINRKFIELGNNAKLEILGFNRSPYVAIDPEILEEQEQAIDDELKRDVSVRTIYLYEEEHWDWIYPHVKMSAGKGEISRVANDLPIKMFIFDRETVYMAFPFIPNQTQTDFVMINIRDKGFAQACMVMFEAYWERAMKLEEWMRVFNAKNRMEN